MRKPARIIRIGAVIAAAMAYACSAIVPSKAQHRVLIRADCPREIAPAFQVCVLNEDGSSGLRIPRNTGHGWNGKGGGFAGYRFYVPSEGSYTLWAYCLWGDPCTNAVYVQMDDSSKIIFGNDPIYLQWHWVRGTEFRLSRGTHDLKLANHSDGISIQRLMLLSDPIEHPSGGRDAYYGIFYEGFDGCDGGNFGTWDLSRSRWQLIQPEGKITFAERWLQGTADTGKDNTPVIASVGEATWGSYILNASVQARKPGEAGICFNWQGPKDYYAVQWSFSGNSDVRDAQVKLVHMKAGQLIILGTAPMSLAMNKWHELELSAYNGQLVVRADNHEVGKIAFSETMKGRIGVLVSNGCVAWFDDIHVRRNTAHDR